jgi:hypothetical protein
MPAQHDGVFGTRRLDDAPTSHPWRWLSLIIFAAVVCGAFVATIATLVEHA